MARYTLPWHALAALPVSCWVHSGMAGAATLFGLYWLACGPLTGQLHRLNKEYLVYATRAVNVARQLPAYGLGHPLTTMWLGDLGLAV